MKISDRITAITNKVIQGDSVADIGTDHGYVPMLLMRNGISPRVIMSDISEGSLAKARETFELCRMSDRVPPSDFRVGDGLETIAAGETDEVIIAGLGGHTIAGILDADIQKSKSFRRLILQPRKHSGTLRYYLFTRGWDIVSEDLAREGKFACEIITAVPSGIEAREAPYPEDDIRWKYPRAMADSDHGLAGMRIEWKISSIEEQLRSLQAAEEDHSQLICKLKSDLSYLNDLMLIFVQI